MPSLSPHPSPVKNANNKIRPRLLFQHPGGGPAAPDLTANNKSNSSNHRKIKFVASERAIIVFLGLFAVLFTLMVLSSRGLSSLKDALVPVSCANDVTIWSHRAHLDAYGATTTTVKKDAATCESVLQTLFDHGIRHFDLDVLLNGEVTLMAHPSEMWPDTTTTSTTTTNHEQEVFVPSPCARLPLDVLLQHLQHICGSTGFFVSLEPKANWDLLPAVADAVANKNKNETTTTSKLAAPVNVIEHLLRVLQEQLPMEIPPPHCGLIMTESQWRRLPWDLQQRIEKVCASTAVVYSRSNLPRGKKRLDEVQPPAKHYRITMPALDHFRSDNTNHHHDEDTMEYYQMLRDTTTSHFLQHTATGTYNVLWMVDSPADLRQALSQPHVHGLISNNPVRLMDDYRELCRRPYQVPKDKLITDPRTNERH